MQLHHQVFIDALTLPTSKLLSLQGCSYSHSVGGGQRLLLELDFFNKWHELCDTWGWLRKGWAFAPWTSQRSHPASLPVSPVTSWAAHIKRWHRRKSRCCSRATGLHVASWDLWGSGRRKGKFWETWLFLFQLNKLMIINEQVGTFCRNTYVAALRSNVAEQLISGWTTTFLANSGRSFATFEGLLFCFCFLNNKAMCSEKRERHSEKDGGNNFKTDNLKTVIYQWLWLFTAGHTGHNDAWNFALSKCY